MRALFRSVRFLRIGIWQDSHGDKQKARRNADTPFLFRYSSFALQFDNQRAECRNLDVFAAQVHFLAG